MTTPYDAERDDYDETPEFSRERVGRRVWASSGLTLVGGVSFVGCVLACTGMKIELVCVCFLLGVISGMFAVWLHYVGRQQERNPKLSPDPLVATFTDMSRTMAYVVLSVNLLVGFAMLVFLGMFFS